MVVSGQTGHTKTDRPMEIIPPQITRGNEMTDLLIPESLVCDLRNHYIEEIRAWEKRYAKYPNLSTQLVIEDMNDRLDRVSKIMSAATEALLTRGK